ncbi:ATP-dependent DNA helicase [Candidatus Woesearchaeota archaeon]|nr:ATP-dependent DNA helicase [Candidatus Woesearchaeota archaeon]
MQPQDVLFPYPRFREVQQELVQQVADCLRQKQNLVVHAPTGMGKTAATLSPALDFALKQKGTVFFLTSRHTQHAIAIDTLQRIRKQYQIPFAVADLIGKKWMCCQEGVERMYTGEFHEYCRAVREKKECSFYEEVWKGSKVSAAAQQLIAELKEAPGHYHEVFASAKERKLCSYEIAMQVAKKAEVVVADYYYLFHPGIRPGFLKKLGKDLGKSIIIVDEGHNLPGRIRELMTARLSSQGIRRAVQEAKRFGFPEAVEQLSYAQDMLNEITGKMQEGERLVRKEEVAAYLNTITPYEQLVGSLALAGEEIREQQKKSSTGAVADFLEAWQGPDAGFARILSAQKGAAELSYRCMDPSTVAAEVIAEAYATILMSGTLAPTSMFRDILGFSQAVEREFPSPFPRQNRLAMIIPSVTTKYAERNHQEYLRIAEICSRMFQAVRGNTAIFFPSYELRNEVHQFLRGKVEQPIFLEEQRHRKEEKHALLERFKEEKDGGALLLGVAAGSFGEGIDLPGDLLKCVIVVGIPLHKPDLETQQLIAYYDQKFSKGWEYGYVLPALSKALQNAGRCIRSETDKGVLAFLDRRYTMPSYFRCFPREWGVKVTTDYAAEIRRFLALS